MLPRYQRFIVLWIVFILTVPMIGGVLSPDRDDASGEKPAPAPGIPRRMKELLMLPQAADDYLRDHFGLRRDIIRSWSLVKYTLLGAGNNKVLVGRDGQLFYRGNNAIEQSTGNLVRESRIVETADTIAQVRDALAARGIRFIFAAAPNTSTVYPDRLPRFLTASGRQTEYDRLLEALAARNVAAVDLRPNLRDAGRAAHIYYLHDTHWTPHGLLVAFNVVAAAAGHRWSVDPATALGPPMMFNGGDLARMLGIAMVESAQPIALSPSSHKVLAPGVHDTAEYRPQVQTGPTILVIGDSFTLDLPRPIVANGGRAIRTDLLACGFDWSWIERLRPDEVWWMPTERFMLCTPAARPKGMRAPGRIE